MDSYLKRYKKILEIEELKGTEMYERLEMSYTAYRRSSAKSAHDARWVIAFVLGYEMANGIEYINPKEEINAEQ
jgi:CRISPR/Cas system endoribonuclease Cas6 (RAMP superfamily)